MGRAVVSFIFLREIFDMPLSVGKKAPDFSLKDREGVSHKLSAIDADFVVLFFYPKDDTPGCTVEAKSFTAAKKKLEKLGAVAIGISGGDEKSKEKFCSKHGLETLMLSDSDFAVSEKYQVYGEKKFMGRTYQGIHRITYVLDRDRKIVKVFDKVKPPTHVEEVLEFLKGYK